MTDLAPPVAGLRNIANRSKSPIHTEVVIPMGAELEVSDDAVADQLVAAGLIDETPVAEEAVSKPARRAKKAQG
mgnify:FL=1